MSKNYFYIIVAIVLVIGAVALRDQLEPQTRKQGTSVAQHVVDLKNGDTYDLVAAPISKVIGGKNYTMLAYNGSIPGPVIKVPQGAEVTINFRNDTGMKTLLHSHGVRMDNAFDGSQTTQKEMEPGETFAYRLKFPDAGIYWYHPHVRDDYAQEMGLYGAFLVTPEKGYWSPVNREIPLFLDDIAIEDGNIHASKEQSSHLLMGSFGTVMLTNGEENYTLRAKKGEVIRLYMTNAANTRTFDFSIVGARMKLVGGDGGAHEQEHWADSVVLGPSERAIVEVLFDQVGAYQLLHKTPAKTYTLGSVIVSDDAVTDSYRLSFDTLQSHTDTIASIDPYRSSFTKEPDKRVTLSVEMGMMGGMDGHMHGAAMGGMGMMGRGISDGIEWEDDMPMMNEMATPDSVKWHMIDQDTGARDMDIDWTFKRGEPVKIRIFNDPESMHPMQHPIHFHGQRFLVVARDGVSQENLVWKDTVLVKAGETVDIVLDTANPGIWMAHCHILEHIEAGMMLKYTVVD